MGKARVLVIEDDAEIRELLEFSLGREGWSPLQAGDGEQGLELLARQGVDCVILDLMLPGMSGLEVLRKLREDPRSAGVPVIVATARGEDADVVAALELGADDYVVKPYSPRVLAARIRAVTRRAATAPAAAAAPLRSGELRLDPERREATLGDASLDLTATEFAILEHLMRNPGRVYTRAQIIDAVRGPDYPVTDRSVDVQVLSLRRKLGRGGELVETVRGVGYRLKE